MSDPTRRVAEHFNQGADHGQSEEENRQRKDRGEGQGQAVSGAHAGDQGPRKMTLTKTQIFHRTDNLSGEIKAAREAQSECRRALEDQERLVAIAAQAVERADARVAELEAERADLAEQARAAILNVGEPVDHSNDFPAEFAVSGDVHKENQGVSLVDHSKEFNSIFTEGADFQAQALAKSVENMNGAYDEATR